MLYTSATQAMKDKMLLLRLEADGALNPEKAVPRAALPKEMELQAAYYLKKGILRSTPGGALYIDKRAYEDHKATQATVGKWVLLVVGLSCLIGFLLLLANRV